ncbi:MAG: hypothetical protein IKW45_00035 [Clostridia bacterium]|nr:hypothetical protein [Clostridia bacterium]
MNKKFNSFKVALGGVISALSIVLMFMTGVVATLTYAIPAICGALLILIVIEISSKFATSVYIAVSILSLLVVADKEAAVMYAMFFGYYPILKGFIEKKLNGVSEWIVKYVVFNIAVISAYIIVSKVFMISFEDIDFLGKFALPLLIVICNIIFAIYDIALTRLLSSYVYSWKKYIKRVFK